MPGDEPGIVLNAHGEGSPRPDADPEENLVILAFREGLRASHGAPMGSGAWRLEVSSMIPAARGLGSSAAALVAGLLLGASVGRSAPSADELLGLAAALEGHPDNVSAALYGGFTLAVGGRGRPAHRSAASACRRRGSRSSSSPPPRAGRSEMRAALPAAVPHHDAALQAGRERAAGDGDPDLGRGHAARRRCATTLHQPYPAAAACPGAVS